MRVALAVPLLVHGLACTGQLVFEHLSRADGIPGQQVLALFEDRDGFIWIGTDAGLARHEGTRIRTFLHDRKDPHSLSNDVIWDITGDEHGRVWVATDHGLCGYDALTGGFDRVAITQAYNDRTSANRIHRVVADGHGTLWLATEDGLHTVALEGGPHEIGLPGQGVRITALTRKRENFTLALDTARDGLWIDRGPGVLFFDAKRRVFVQSPSDELPFTVLRDTLSNSPAPDGQRGLWYYSRPSSEVIHVNGEGVVLQRHHLTSEDRGWTSPQFIRAARNGDIWLSTWTHQLFRQRAGTDRWQGVPHDDRTPWSIISSNAKSWIEDQAGRLWIGTYEGISVLDPALAGLVPVRVDTEGGAGISSIHAVDTNTVLLGVEAQGLVRLDRATGVQHRSRFTEHGSDPVSLTWSNFPLCWARHGAGWLLGTHNGLFRYDPSTGRIERPTELLRQARALEGGSIAFTVPDGRGTLWIGHRSAGLFTCGTTGTVTSFAPAGGPALPARSVRSIAAQDRDVWVGYDGGGGICRITNERVTERLLGPGDTTNEAYGVVRSLTIDGDGTLYIGTLMGGLGVHRPDTLGVDWFTRSDGLTGDRIEELVADRQRSIWIHTNDGLCRFDARSRVIDRFDLPASMRGEGSLSAIALDVDGSLLCAYGSLLIDIPTTMTAPASAPEVKLTSLTFEGRTVHSWPAGSILELPFDERALSCEFGALAFLNSGRVRFAYRIVDLDTTWHALGDDARLELNDLPKGLHQVQVRANTGGSGWTTTPWSLRVRVLPPFYATWWFRVALVLLIATALFVAFRLYLRERLREERLRIEREQVLLSERLRIAGDMHDDLGAGLSALKMRSEMALRVERDPATRAQLSGLADAAGELIGSMRQIIWTMSADQASLEDLVSYTSNYARTYCQQHALKLEVALSATWPTMPLSPEVRRNVLLVVKEALHNTAKHAHAGQLRLRMEWHDGLAVAIEDDGTGLPAGPEPTTGNGLRNMRRRITALGGSFTLDASEGGGARIRFHVPLRAAVTTERSIASTDAQ